MLHPTKVQVHQNGTLNTGIGASKCYTQQKYRCIKMVPPTQVQVHQNGTPNTGIGAPKWYPQHRYRCIKMLHPTKVQVHKMVPPTQGQVHQNGTPNTGIGASKCYPQHTPSVPHPMPSALHVVMILDKHPLPHPMLVTSYFSTDCQHFKFYIKLRHDHQMALLNLVSNVWDTAYLRQFLIPR